MHDIDHRFLLCLRYILVVALLSLTDTNFFTQYLFGGGKSISSMIPTSKNRKKYNQHKKYILRGKQWKIKDLKVLLRNAGFSQDEIPVMLCIMKWESSFFERALNYNNNGSIDFGLFQINNRYWGKRNRSGCSYVGSELLNYKNNLRCARKIYQKKGYNAWNAYKKHKVECLNYKV